MNFDIDLINNGKLKTYVLRDEIEELAKIDKNKPSSRIIRTKKGQDAIAALANIEKNHNHSWYRELLAIKEKNPNATALFYRGNKISFDEMIKKADDVAKSLSKLGIKKGDEIPACLSNTPELVYLMLAINKIGAKLNAFGSNYNKEYVKEIIDRCTDKVFIATDNVYGEIEKTISEKNYKNKVLISLADSLPEHPELTDEYEPKLKDYYHYDNKVNTFKEYDSNILAFNEFVDYGSDYNKKIIDDNDLNTEFLVTYTSGSTKIGYPSAMIHSNRSLITSGIFHQPELSGNPKIEGLRGLAHIHSDSNTNLITCISDNLMQQWSVGLEPEYDKDKFLDYLFINKPNYANATTSFILNASKQYLLEKKYHENGDGRKLPFLLALFAVGEGVTKGEEKFINKFLRKSRAGSGVKIKGFHIPFTTLSIGGGDCEHGGIYYTLWKSTFEKIDRLKLRKSNYGMKPEPYVHVTVLKPGKKDIYSECDYNEMGIIVANSATTMVGYKDKKEATKKMILRDENNRDWITTNVYGYIDNMGTVHIKGRIGNEIELGNGKLIAPFMIEDVIQKDTKNIMSCVVSQEQLGDKKIPVVNIEFQPDKKKTEISILNSVNQRCLESLPKELNEKLFFRIFDNKTSFPLTGSGKRSFKALDEMNLKNTFKIIDEKQVFMNNESIEAIIDNNVKQEKTIIKR